MTVEETAPGSIQELLQPIENGVFRFACNPSVPCFTECCRDLRLLLTPYDILRVKTHLGITADAFIEEYGDVHFDEKRLLPMIHLKMDDNARRTCPFVSPEGCGIYENRPSACRIYPVARASRFHRVHGALIENHYLLHEEHCRGFEEGREWTLEDWIVDQGLESYHEMNNLWMQIIADGNLRKHRPLSEKQQQMFFMVCYNLERFRDFVFGTRFLQLFDIPEIEEKAIRTDDIALLKLGFKWLNYSLLNRPVLNMRPRGETKHPL